MPIRNVFAEAWSAVNATGLMVVAFVLMFAPFLVSLIANIGRPVPKAVQARPARLRSARAVRTLPS